MRKLWCGIVFVGLIGCAPAQQIITVKTGPPSCIQNRTCAYVKKADCCVEQCGLPDCCCCDHNIQVTVETKYDP